MDLVTLVVLTVLGFGGVWGAIIITSLLKRRDVRLQAGPSDPRIDVLQDDNRLLEARIERLEEEVNFLSELKAPASLPSGGSRPASASD